MFTENRKESTKNLIAVIALHFYILANAKLKLKYNIIECRNDMKYIGRNMCKVSTPETPKLLKEFKSTE